MLTLPVAGIGAHIASWRRVAMALTAEVLSEWREAERTLRLLPDDAPERPAVEAAIEEMRFLYHRVTSDTVPDTVTAIEQTKLRVAETRALLRRVRGED
jgi:hypothetical protein